MAADRRRGRYAVAGPVYDLLALERPVYRRPRRHAVAALRLRPGDRVCDVGCGTGLSLALLRDAVGSAGVVVGVDASASMLGRARARVERAGWSNVRLVQADAAAAPRSTDTGAVAAALGAPADGVLLTYALSVIPEWEAAWAAALRLGAAGTRVATAELGLPVGHGPGGAVARAAARAAGALGGADFGREPWRLVERDLADVRVERLLGGHVVVAAGVVPAGRRHPPNG